MPPDVAYVLICCFCRLILSTEEWAQTTSLREDKSPSSRCIERMNRGASQNPSVVAVVNVALTPTRTVHNLDS
jgi:hypothetical protein